MAGWRRVGETGNNSSNQWAQNLQPPRDLVAGHVSEARRYHRSRSRLAGRDQLLIFNRLVVAGGREFGGYRGQDFISHLIMSRDARRTAGAEQDWFAVGAREGELVCGVRTPLTPS